MKSDQSSNKIIAKNTIYLNIRMVLVILVNLYVARVVLKELGVTDYGIYNVIAGIVTMLAFLNSSMSVATSRFLTFEMGHGNHAKLVETFRTSLFLHILVGTLLLVLAETIGVWFVNNHLVIPQQRIIAANWVFQISIITMVANIIQVPFYASIIANEKMEVYAWIEIIKNILILLLVLSINISPFDNLIYYSLIVLFAALLSLISYLCYCKKRFEECSLVPLCHKKSLKPILSFSVYDLYANFAATIRTQGISVIINWFFGPSLNAANAISNQIQAAIFNFSNTVTSAFRPQMIKSYATDNYQRLEDLLNTSSLISFFLYSCLAVPIIIDMPFILNLWLGKVPDFTIDIARITVITSSISLINTILIIPIHAKGRIKLISILGGTIYLFAIPVAYLYTRLIRDALSPYYVVLIFMLLLVVSTSIILNYEIKVINTWKYYYRTVFPSLLFIGGAWFFVSLLHESIEEGLLRFCIITICYILLSLVMFSSYSYSTLSKENKNIVRNIVKKIIKRYKE